MKTLEEWQKFRNCVYDLHKWVDPNMSGHDLGVYDDIVRVLCIVLAHELDLARKFWDLKD